MTNWQWADAHVLAFDFETSGSRPEWALQPWRRRTGDFWATSLVWMRPSGSRLVYEGSLDPTVGHMREMLEWAIYYGCRIWGWHTVYDISVLLAYGLEDLVFKVKWGDGMLLWRHLDIEPEYDDHAPKKSRGLKDYVREFLPQYADYEAGVDFHDPSPEARAKLHEYNVQDVAFTLKGCKRLWHALEPCQQAAALIEADCLPMIARANLEGLLIDTIAANDQVLKMKAIADAKLALLGPDGVTEKVIRSPKQLATLLFETWGLPVHKLNKPNAKGEQTRSTDKEVLFELAFIDPRAKELRAYREALNLSKKFAQTLIASAAYNGDGRSHPLARVFGTYSSRFTYASKQRKKKEGGYDEEVEGAETSEA